MQYPRTSVNIVNKSGAWYSYKNGKLGQGRENSKVFLKENPTLLEELETEVRQFFKVTASFSILNQNSQNHIALHDQF